MKKLIILLLGILSIAALRAQDRPPHSELENPSIQGINKENSHATFINYDKRENALLNDNSKSKYLISLNGTWKFKFVIGISNRIRNFAVSELSLSDWKTFSDKNPVCHVL